MTPTCCRLLLMLALLGTSAAVADPLPVRDHFLLGEGFLALEPASADVLDRREWRLEAVWSLSNSWAISPQIDLALRARTERGPVTLEELDELARRSSDGGSIFIDGELSRLTVALRRGLGQALEIEIQLPLVDFGGGALDGAIESFHESLDLSQDGRTGGARDQFLISTTTRRGDVLVERPPGLALGDVVVGAKLKLSEGANGRSRAALRALVKLPTGAHQPIGSSGKIDYGLQFLAGRELRRWSLHGAAGVVFLGASDRLGLAAQRLYSLAGALELAAGPRTRLLLQLDVAESPFSSYATARIGEEAIHATLGVARVVGRRNELFAAATENFQNFTNSADISLHLGFSRALR